jgi:hypothetical protein
MKQQSRPLRFWWSAIAVAFALARIPAAGQSNVYSLNVVGYINVPFTNGYTFFANPLDHYTNNANDIMWVVEGALLYRFDPSTQAYCDAAIYHDRIGWTSLAGTTNDPALELPLGEGFVVWSPTPWLNTFVGNVMQGNLTNPIPAHWSLKSCFIPLAGPLQSLLSFPSRPNDQVARWRGSFSRYDFTDTWRPFEPEISVGEGFFVYRDPLYATRANWWIFTFYVQDLPPVPLLVQPASTVRATGIHLARQSRSISVQVSNPLGDTYAVQFSTDRAVWRTIAAGQSGGTWSEPMRGGVQGFYRVVSN